MRNNAAANDRVGPGEDKVAPVSSIIGVDFSASTRAGEKIWCAVASGTSECLHITGLHRGLELPGSGVELNQALEALRNWLIEQTPALCGFDFPLSLPAAHLEMEWEQWLRQTVGAMDDATQFRERYPEEKRQTDKAARAPFAPLNLRMYRQTFYGLRDLVLPLVTCRHACAVPMQSVPTNQPSSILLEVCPACWLKSHNLYLSYKGKNSAQAANREIIWGELQTQIPLKASAEIGRRCIEDSEGDALDAVVAAICVWKNSLSPGAFVARNGVERREGRIYF